MPRRTSQIHYRHCTKARSKNAFYILYARSFTHLNWPKTDITISELVRDIKTGSTHFINDTWGLRNKFNRQEGFGAFSYSKSQVDSVIKYILNQETHHKKITFKDEYISFLKKFEIEYKERYLFDWME